METHGCRLNQAESEAMAEALRARGHELVRAVEDADLYLLNSCAITHEADADARAALRRAKRRNPGLEVVVTGCYANAEPERLQAMAEVDAVLGNLEKQHDLGPVLEGLLTRRDRGPLVAVSALSRKLRPQPWSL
ncbi:MAG: hypothetical protein KC431_15485, partial [Myxococcales bacterium]|nr:hypothetical protein [Myxococcales bacterium]